MRVAAHFDSDEPLTAQQVAESEGISAPYAQKLLRQLALADLIESRRRAGGGYVLGRHPERISVLDVVRALDAEFETADVCQRHTGELDACTHTGTCTIRPVWSFIEDFVSRTLDRLTLATLLAGSGEVRRQLHSIDDDQLYCPVAQFKARHE